MVQGLALEVVLHGVDFLQMRMVVEVVHPMDEGMDAEANVKHLDAGKSKDNVERVLRLDGEGRMQEVGWGPQVSYPGLRLVLASWGKHLDSMCYC